MSIQVRDGVRERCLVFLKSLIFVDYQQKKLDRRLILYLKHSHLRPNKSQVGVCCYYFVNFKTLFDREIYSSSTDIVEKHNSMPCCFIRMFPTSTTSSINKLHSIRCDRFVPIQNKFIYFRNASEAVDGKKHFSITHIVPEN